MKVHIMPVQKPILVTGAAGNIGAVGRTLTELLLAKGKTVRAMVHRDDARADSLRKMGAEVVIGDLLSLEDMNRIIEGCGSIYFGMSVSDAYLEATVNVAAVAKHHGVEAFINMSQMTVSQMSVTETTDSPQQKMHWLAEETLNWSGLPVVHVRPTVFMDGFFLQFSAGTIKARNEIRVPFGSGETSPIAAQDVAKAVSAILLNPELHIGSVYHLTGPESKDMAFYANEFTQVLGRPIQYVDTTVAAWRENMTKAGLSKHVLDHLSTMADLHRAGRYARMTTDFKKLTGEDPITVSEFVRSNIEAFNP
jgi:uncharacterized protein YbjT (DUF2867 family)